MKNILFIRLFKEHCKTTKSAPFPWLPKSFILVAKMPKPDSNLHPVRQKAGVSRTDDREELRQLVCDSAKKTSAAWIVKSTAGSKGS